MNNNFFNPNMFNTPVIARGMPIGGSSFPRLFGNSLRCAGTSKVTFSGILNGASKTLGVINQAIPVFYQVKPIWNNAKTMFRVAKQLGKDDNKKEEIKTMPALEKKISNSPTFFI